MEIPLGSATRIGVVVNPQAEPPEGVQLKAITRVLPEPPVPEDLLELAFWMAIQYGCAKTVALALVVGPRFSAQARAASIPKRQRQLMIKRVTDRVEGVELTKRQRELAEGIPTAWVLLTDILERLKTGRPTLSRLADTGVVIIDERFVDEISNPPTASAFNHESDDGAGDGADDGADDGAGGNIALVGAARGRAAAQLKPSVQLTDAQLNAAAICAGVHPDGPGNLATLLIGVTGSGKTEVYLEAIAARLELNETAIVLVPEIALTPQTARRFKQRFPDLVEVLHSQMTPAQRARAHQRISSGEVRVVVGARSAIFAPVQNLGIIIIDEEHDNSYKQDSEPRYDARRVAYKRALINNARIVFGSATPRAESWVGLKQRLILRERPGGGRLAPVEIVNLKAHEDEYPLTTPLREAIELTLRRDKQVIILHNRRGYSTGLHCRSCGTTVRCSHCDVALIVHGVVARRQRLVCHHCGLNRPLPDVCGECASSNLARMGAGTEQLETRLAEIFTVPIMRLDADAVKTRGAVEEILTAFAAAGPAILVGTQMVAKGHDFSQVELAIVIDADSALAIPDFRAEERAFALVAQLAGRAGRSADTADHARVLIQAWEPQLGFLHFAQTHDVEGFMQQELESRSELGFPPYQRMVRVVVSARDAREAQQWNDSVAAGLANLAVGPVHKAPLMRIKDRARFHSLVSTQQIASVTKAVRAFLQKTDSQRRKRDVRVILDVDPQSFL